MNAIHDTTSHNMIVFGGAFIPRNNVTTVLSNASGVGDTPAWIELLRSDQLLPGRSHKSVVYDSTKNFNT